MSAIILGTFVTAACIAISVGGLTLVRKRANTEDLKMDHDVAAALIAVLGTLYAIVLGLVVVDALNHREQAELMEAAEGNSLATIMHLVRTIPVPIRRPIMQTELDYCQAAIDREWDMLDKGNPPDKETLKAFGLLWEKVASYEPATNRETNLHNYLLSAMTEFSNARRYRIVTCQHGLPPLLWLILIVGGICTIIFTYFFAAARSNTQALMTSIVSLMLCLNVLLVYFYGSPYKGDLRIEPHGLMHARDILLKAPVLQNKDNPTETAAPAMQKKGNIAQPAPSKDDTANSISKAAGGKAPACNGGSSPKHVDSNSAKD